MRANKITMNKKSDLQASEQSGEKMMPEGEVMVRIGLYLLQCPSAVPTVTISLDRHHVVSGGKLIFDVMDFLRGEGWNKTNGTGPNPWNGEYTKHGFKLVVSSLSRGGDVIATIGRKRVRVECKKGPLGRKKGNPENKLVNEAIGQLVSIEEVDAENDVLLVAVPNTAPHHRKTELKDRPLMKRCGIAVVLVGRDGTVVGMPDLREASQLPRHPLPGDPR